MHYLENLFQGAKRIRRIAYAGLASLVLFYGCEGCSTIPIQESIETKIGATDSTGQISFTDNSTLEEVVLQVVDAQANPVQEMEITYWDGEGFEVFLVNSPSNEYLPSIGIYPTTLLTL